jgi:nicotinamide-nucleotide amidase
VKAAAGGAVILSRTLHTFGLGESSVADKLKARGDLMNRGRNPSVGTTVTGGIVSLRLNARFDSSDEARKQLQQTVAECQAALGDLIFGEEDGTLPGVIARLLLEDPKNRTVSTAESCTGGLIARMLTDTPGSSAYFTHGWVTYSNAAKTELLGVQEDLLREHGAVSEPVVRAMAEGAKQRAKSAYALAVSGIAGPDGGTPTKPVGTVCFGIAHPSGVDSRTIVMIGDREMIRDRSAKMALTMLRFHLLGQPLPC